MSRGLIVAAGAGVALYLLWRRWRRDDLAATFARDGYCIIRNALSPEECDAIEANYNKLTHPTPEMEAKMGRDFGDQSQGFGVKQADFVLINVLQPGKHLKGFDDNPFVRRCREWTRTLIGDGCAIDYAQLLEKVANRPNAVFPWHQDMQYWPKRSQASTRTCTFSLALTDADEANGCLRVIPGTGLTKELFNERSAVEDGQEIYEEKRAIVLPLTAKEKAAITLLPVKRGDVTVHDEWIVHGSGGNVSDRVRKTYVVAFRDKEMIAYERKVGFAHSYEDKKEVLAKVRSGEL